MKPSHGYLSSLDSFFALTLSEYFEMLLPTYRLCEEEFESEVAICQ